jgi:hypothetical protein
MICAVLNVLRVLLAFVVIEVYWFEAHQAWWERRMDCTMAQWYVLMGRLSRLWFEWMFLAY